MLSNKYFGEHPEKMLSWLKWSTTRPHLYWKWNFQYIKNFSRNSSGKSGLCQKSARAKRKVAKSGSNTLRAGYRRRLQSAKQILFCMSINFATSKHVQFKMTKAYDINKRQYNKCPCNNGKDPRV